jgi:alkanesulfonate monooxygenase SsuD/methylene tetrahydromethanopterin reductase-like flavin-dependent oxidoreductase (luciferase family)
MTAFGDIRRAGTIAQMTIKQTSGPALGAVGFRISATGSAGLDWQKLESTWTACGEHDVFSAGWLSDHLSDVSRERGGTAFEAFTTAAALAHRVPEKWIGLAVAANTFRHPAVLAKQATTLDIVTGGRFILGLGAGWHVGEHEAFGVPLPEPRERMDRYEAALRVLRALFSDEARRSPGVTLDDPFYPLDRATNDPPPLSVHGPRLWMGGQGRRSIELIGRYATGWPMYGNRAGDVEFFVEKRDQILRSLADAGRDVGEFTFAAQVDCGSDARARGAALQAAKEMMRAGAQHMILGLPGHAAPDQVPQMVREVAVPLSEVAATRA